MRELVARRVERIRDAMVVVFGDAGNERMDCTGGLRCVKEAQRVIMSWS